MLEVFLDANILFAAVRSSSGGSYFIIELVKKKKISVVTVAHALAEAERNIGEKIGEKALDAHYENLLSIKPTIQSVVNLPISLEEKLRSVIPEKDIPILAGALLSGVKILITLDQKHFLKNPKLKQLAIEIMTPGDFIKLYIL